MTPGCAGLTPSLSDDREGCGSAPDEEHRHHPSFAGNHKPDDPAATPGLSAPARPPGKDYFVREIAYGAFQRSFALPEGVDAAEVKAKHASGMLEVRGPAPRALTPRMIEVTAN